MNPRRKSQRRPRLNLAQRSYQVMEQCRVPRLFPLRLAILVTVGVILASSCHAGTLFERSLAKMEERAQKASPQDFTFVVLGDSRDNDGIFRKALELAAT